MPHEVSFPPLPLAEWEHAKITLHLFAQIVGKIRLTLAPSVNHWWHVPLYVSARGLTTGAIPFLRTNVDMEFDFVAHQLVIRSSTGVRHTVPLPNRSVADFYRDVRSALADLDIEANILAKPFDPARVKSAEPFATDTEHRGYNGEYVSKFWRILVAIDPLFRAFRGRFAGKCSPVHFFWHSFDLAVTRFSGRRAPVQKGADPVTRSAYSHEVISAGFWVGDDNLPEPAFYSYAYPEPAGLGEQPLRPAAATWVPQGGGSMAVLRYDDFRRADDPGAALLDFLQSAYEAGATLADWPRGELEL